LLLKKQYRSRKREEAWKGCYWGLGTKSNGLPSCEGKRKKELRGRLSHKGRVWKVVLGWNKELWRCR
jgi:hypothetical protein